MVGKMVASTVGCWAVRTVGYLVDHLASPLVGKMAASTVGYWAVWTVGYLVDHLATP